jgi:uncharacterized phage protein (TIGR02218 family)
MSAVELFHFYTRDNDWRFAADVANVTADSQTWTAAAISRSKFTRERGGEFTVTVPSNLAPFTFYRNSTPGTALKVKVYKTDGTTLIGFGDATEVKYSDKSKREIVFTRDGVMETQNLLKFKFQKTCNHTVGDANCGVTLSTYQVTVPQSAVTGTAISHANIGGEADGYWLRGWAKNGNETRTILSHSGNDITINAPFVENTTGDVTISPGCDGTKSTCENKFNNLANHFGFPNIPEADPHLAV